MIKWNKGSISNFNCHFQVIWLCCSSLWPRAFVKDNCEEAIRMQEIISMAVQKNKQIINRKSISMTQNVVHIFVYTQMDGSYSSIGIYTEQNFQKGFGN